MLGDHRASPGTAPTPDRPVQRSRKGVLCPLMNRIIRSIPRWVTAMFHRHGQKTLEQSKPILYGLRLLFSNGWKS